MLPAYLPCVLIKLLAFEQCLWRYTLLQCLCGLIIEPLLCTLLLLQTAIKNFYLSTLPLLT